MNIASHDVVLEIRIDAEKHAAWAEKKTVLLNVWLPEKIMFPETSGNNRQYEKFVIGESNVVLDKCERCQQTLTL